MSNSNHYTLQQFNLVWALLDCWCHPVCCSSVEEVGMDSLGTATVCWSWTPLVEIVRHSKTSYFNFRRPANRWNVCRKITVCLSVSLQCLLIAIVVCLGLSVVYMKQSRLSEAEEVASESLRMFTAIQPDGSPDIQNGYSAVSDLSVSCGHIALFLAEQILHQIWQRKYGY